MHWQTSIWILVLAAALVGRVESQLMQELADKLNLLVHHPAWKNGMDRVKIVINDGRDLADPMTEILEAMTSGRNPVDESNVLGKHKEIFNLLQCKYAEVIYEYKVLLKHFVRVCRSEKNLSSPKFYDCFDWLLIKLHSAYPRFKCMQDALGLIDSLHPPAKQPKDKTPATAVKMLAAFTLTVRPETKTKLFARGLDEDSVDLELQTINDTITGVYRQYVYRYTYNHCRTDKKPERSAREWAKDLERKKTAGLIPLQTTMMEHVQNQINCFVQDIMDSCFFELGFAYGAGGAVTIRPI